jgi:hypothetical protein
LDKLKEGLIKEMTDNFFDWKKMSDSAKEAIEKDKYPRSGYGLEAIETAVFREVLRRAKKKGKAIHSGRSLIKADNILALGIDSSFVQKAIERAGKNRNENVQAFNELGR